MKTIITGGAGFIGCNAAAALFAKPITVYGDGKQVRDVLFIDDLLDAYDAAFANIDRTRGMVYNIGGGPQNVMSLRQLLDFLSHKQNRAVPFACGDWRAGDQRVYVSNISRAKADFGWAPKIRTRQGLELLYDWVSANRELFR
jgi:CDP-paratose 2-epimerase